jgi:hypothetical protein
MDVEIGELSSTVRAVDGSSILSPRAMDQIVRAVLRALEDQKEHDRRVRAEQRVSRGVSHEQADGECC